uniref:N-myc downstream regulated n=3 Tax=Pararge aegeria TaxID=116150 RepID=S4PWQ3_9NEOP
MLSEYRSRLRGNLNTHNIKQYVRAFIHRKDLVLRGCQPDILLITGLLSPYAGVVEKMYKELDKERVTILKVDRAGDVLSEAPAKVAQSLLLFCQGQSQLTSLPPPGVERRMSRAMSMEEYDKPNIRRLSLTPHVSETPLPRKL